MFFPEVEFQAGGRYFARYILFPSDQFAMCKLFLKPSKNKPVLYTLYNDNQLDDGITTSNTDIPFDNFLILKWSH